jgi:hypothetical protein
MADVSTAFIRKIAWDRLNILNHRIGGNNDCPIGVDTEEALREYSGSLLSIGGRPARITPVRTIITARASSRTSQLLSDAIECAVR